MNSLSRNHVLVGILSLSLFIAGGHAATYTWDAGGANPLWSTGTNWVGDTVPTFAAADTFALTEPIVTSGTSTVDFSSTLGIINIIGSANGTATWTLNRFASEVLTLDNGASAAQINTLLTTASNATANTISVPIAITGDLNVNNQARAKTLLFTENISSLASSGTQTITLSGNTTYGSTIKFTGGISNGSSGGKIAVVANAKNSTVIFNTSTANTYTGGTTLTAGEIQVGSGAFGADGSSLTINGISNEVTLRNGSSGSTLNLGALNIFTNFYMDGVNYTRIAVSGSTAVNLGSGTRTISGRTGTPNIRSLFATLDFAGTGQTINDGTLRILGTNSASVTAPTSLNFTSAVTFNNADLTIGAKATTTMGVNNAFGTDPAHLPGVTVETDGALNLSSSAYVGSVSRDLTIGSLSGAGKVINSAATSGTATLTINGATSTTFSGTIQNGGYDSQTAGIVALTKAGSSTLTLAGANTYTGATTVNAGTLLIDGNGSAATGAVTVSGSTAILGGSGTIGGAVTIQSGGKLAPGDSPGILTVANDVTIANDGIFSAEINGATVGATGYDRLIVTGVGSDFSLTGTNDLVLSLGYMPAANSLFFLVDNQGSSAISGIFEKLNGVTTDLSQDAQFTVGGQNFNISYTGDLGTNTFSGAGDDLVIQAVPEPSTALLIILPAVFLCLLRRPVRQ